MFSCSILKTEVALRLAGTYQRKFLYNPNKNIPNIIHVILFTNSKKTTEKAMQLFKV